MNNIFLSLTLFFYSITFFLPKKDSQINKLYNKNDTLFYKNYVKKQGYNNYEDVKQISFSEIASLPIDILLCKNLEKVKIIYSPKLSFDDALKVLAKLHHLRVLDISINRVETLSTNIGLLTNLEELKLTSNFISILPKEIKHCQKLKKIFLDNQANFNLDGKQIITTLKFNTNGGIVY